MKKTHTLSCMNRRTRKMLCMMHWRRGRWKKNHGIKSVASPCSYQKVFYLLEWQRTWGNKWWFLQGKEKILANYAIQKITKSIQLPYASCLCERFSHPQEEDKGKPSLSHCFKSHRLSKMVINRVYKPTNHYRQK